WSCTSNRSCTGAGRIFRRAWRSPWPPSMCWSSGTASSPTRRASCPSRSLNLVCKIPISLFSLSETNTIGYYAPNTLSPQYLSLVEPRYDFVVVDEVQDLTTIQLQLILQSLREPHQFLLCGDANQIVHPNFFSWSQL